MRCELIVTHDLRIVHDSSDGRHRRAAILVKIRSYRDRVVSQLHAISMHGRCVGASEVRQQFNPHSETRVIRGPVGENNCSLAWRKSKKGTDGCLLASCGWPGLSLWISGYAIPTAPSLSSLPSFVFLLQFLNFKRLIFTLFILSLPL